MDAEGHQNRGGSIAEIEFGDAIDPEAVRTLYSHAEHAIVVSSDAMVAMERALTEPVLTFALWTLARVVLENTASVMWLLDSDADLDTRIGRSMTLRFVGLRRGRSLVMSAVGIAPTTEVDGATASEEVAAKIESLLAHATARAIPICKDKTGKVLGFGDGPATFTKRVEAAFDAVWLYRLLSGAAHGEFWATRYLGLKQMGESLTMEQHNDLDVAYAVVTSAIDWWSRACHEFFKRNGWDMRRLEEHFAEQYEAASIGSRARFW